MEKKSIWTAAIGIVSLIFAFLIGVYPEQIRAILNSVGLTDSTVILYSVIASIVLLIALGISLLAWTGYEKYLRTNLTIQPESLIYFKYPFFASRGGQGQQYTNMAYGSITVKNMRKERINDCSLEIDLRQNNVSRYKSKVLSHRAMPVNPISVAIDGDGQENFLPIALRLESNQAILPNISGEGAGAVTGVLVADGEYQIFGRMSIEGKCQKWVPLGNITIPQDILTRATIANDIQAIIDHRGFAFFAEITQGMVRAKFFGTHTDGDVNRALAALRRSNLEVDLTIEDNGQQRIIEDRPRNDMPPFLLF